MTLRSVWSVSVVVAELFVALGGIVLCRERCAEWVSGDGGGVMLVQKLRRRWSDCEIFWRFGLGVSMFLSSIRKLRSLVRTTRRRNLAGES